MDELQDRLVRVGLDVLADYGFALAGGYALQAHHLVDRMSEDVDLFTNRWDTNEFARAVEAVAEAYRKEGIEVTVVRRADTFARLQVVDPRTTTVGSVDMAADFRDREPVRLSVGPVLAERDAVASKVATVFSRGEARDYLDLAGILESGRFSREELMDVAAGVDAGFSKRVVRRSPRRGGPVPRRRVRWLRSQSGSHRPGSRDDARLEPSAPTRDRSAGSRALRSSAEAREPDAASRHTRLRRDAPLPVRGGEARITAGGSLPARPRDDL
jgi:hypothetical protein